MTGKGHTHTGKGRVGLRSIPPRFLVALIASIVAAAMFAVPTEAPTEAAQADVVGFSMVEFLDDEAAASGRTFSLKSVRNHVLDDGRFGGDHGAGVDVAVIDTGVSPVRGLSGDKVVHGPDMSGEGRIAEVAYLDTYGHGTHMAGIIAGGKRGNFGVARNARIVSVKVAGADGFTTVPQVVAAIDWVVDHKDSDGLNIRVLNLSLGVAGVTSHIGDPLSAAVERAWDAGIVVVVAGGNRGDSQGHLDSPAIDPYPITVAAVDASVTTYAPRQPVPDWSSVGDGVRNPDLSAPGRTISSYRVPGSTIDTLAPEAVRSTDGSDFVGSGTSQAAAVISGLAARLIGEHPELTPDQVKATLVSNAIPLEYAGETQTGAGRVFEDDLVLTGVEQNHARAAGPSTGILAPEGDTWSGGGFTNVNWDGATWTGTVWSGGVWSGATWAGATWAGATWAGATWSGATWAGATWAGATWAGATWTGATWTGSEWAS